MPEPDDAEAPAPVRRVSMIVTGYLRHGCPIAGFYDMQSAADGGMQYSIPQFAVDEASVKDAPPERMSDDDWAEISGHVLARFGAEDGERILAAWGTAAADVEQERLERFHRAQRGEHDA